MFTIAQVTIMYAELRPGPGARVHAHVSALSGMPAPGGDKPRTPPPRQGPPDAGPGRPDGDVGAVGGLYVRPCSGPGTGNGRAAEPGAGEDPGAPAAALDEGGAVQRASPFARHAGSAELRPGIQADRGAPHRAHAHSGMRTDESGAHAASALDAGGWPAVWQRAGWAAMSGGAFRPGRGMHSSRSAPPAALHAGAARCSIPAASLIPTADVERGEGAPDAACRGGSGTAAGAPGGHAGPGLGPRHTTGSSPGFAAALPGVPERGESDMRTPQVCQSAVPRGGAQVAPALSAGQRLGTQPSFHSPDNPWE
jgi:hypothetical protein